MQLGKTCCYVILPHRACPVASVPYFDNTPTRRIPNACDRCPVFRLVVGALARIFYPGSVGMGWLMTILLGIGGSLLADFAVNRAAPIARRG
jgi:hypothetical protein